MTKWTIEKMQQIAAARGGRCLSTEYLNSTTKLRWQCKKGHRWEAVPYPIKHGTWCPICKSGVSENICRHYFETIFHEKFPKIRPEWLTSSNGRRLELDGYCQKLNLAFEYNGQQHYDDTFKYVFKNRTFKEQQKSDDTKRTLCKEYKVTLIEVPHTVTHGLMGKYILEECKQRGVAVPDIDIEKIDYREFDCYSATELLRIKKIAADRGGECLSNNYIDSQTKLKFRCREGHTFEMIPNTLLCQGSWCRFCTGLERGTIQQMQKLAESRGGRCLSTEYINATTKLKWECKEKHTWWTVPGSIKNQKSWCPVCARKEQGKTRLGTIEEMRDIAKSRGGICRSEIYVDCLTPLEWECAKGHVWKTRPVCIKIGHWCPDCGKSKRLTIGAMQTLAEKQNGRCLSNIYINEDTPLKWECEQGHIWDSRPRNIIRGSWCNICRRNTNSH